MKNIILLLLVSFHCHSFAQNSSKEKLAALEQDMIELENQKEQLLDAIEGVKLEQIRIDLKKVGLPSKDYVEHKAMFLSYNEANEQPNWVGHIILPDIISGRVSRTNIFMEDPLVTTGTAVEEDYFLKTLKSDETYDYDGFGYDRGHLAPSADFRWSKIALAESYFYSNMSPQLAEFNREKWGELENLLRAYVYNFKEVSLVVFTGPVLTANLPKIPRAVNNVTIPKFFWKVALDIENKRAIGFIMPHKDIQNSIDNYAVTIDEVETLTGFDFFNELEDDLENGVEGTIDLAAWFPDIAAGDVQPIAMNILPKKTYNTSVAAKQKGMGTKIAVVGKVVDGRYTRKGNIILNLDKRYPNQQFSVFIRKEHLVNFPSDPLEAFNGEYIRIKGTVESLGTTATMYIKSGNAIEFFKE